MLTALALLGTGAVAGGATLKPDGYHVLPGEEIQAALDQAAKNPTNKVVKVHAGVYRPGSVRQALIWFNRAHEGVRLEGVGEVVLTAANPELSDPKSASHPAVVNHIVYFGDGLSAKTVMKGFRLVGANGFVTRTGTEQMEPDQSLPKGLFFFHDGGAIKVFGRSYPVLQQIELADNYSSPCGAGISVQHEGHGTNYVTIQDCVFRNNRAEVTGAAIDLLEGSSAKVINCLFTGNSSNLGPDTISTRDGNPPFTNNGVVTLFEGSRIWMERCTLTGNRNGVDDMQGASLFRDCIFWRNNLEAGLPGGERFALDLQTGSRVSGCYIDGKLPNPYNGPNQVNNVLNPPAPNFDKAYVPQAKEYSNVGYRPVEHAPGARPASPAVNPSAR